MITLLHVVDYNEQSSMKFLVTEFPMDIFENVKHAHVPDQALVQSK